ncbi:hypothetical protein Brms1b_013087 [Colletotrichum noveboracense]|nr:hypothetical protein Brms1b_013087 [Colletotrichum noveboracense]
MIESPGINELFEQAPSKVRMSFVQETKTSQSRASFQYDWQTSVPPAMLRAPEVTLGADWDHKVDIWNLGLVVWELTQGAVLFDGSWTPQDPYTGEAQLAQMTSLLGAFPKSLLSRSRECDRYFTSDGNLLKPSTFGSLCLNDMCKNRLNCDMSDSDRADFLDFIMAMIRLDPAERPDAKTLLGHKWIQEA